MLDFWFTVGSAIIDPTFLTKLNAVPPVFTPVQRTIIENGVTAIQNSPVSGFLDQTGTTNLQQQIRTLLKTAAPTLPISIHCAGKMSQLLSVGAFAFVAQVTLANTAYQTACAKAGVTTAASNFSKQFPAFLGVCLLDANLTASLAAGPGNDSDDVMKQFGVSSDAAHSDLKVASQLVAPTSDFIKAQTALLGGVGWQAGCGEQMMFWGAASNGANIRAILP